MRKRPEALLVKVPAGESARWSQACVNLPEVISSALLSDGSQKLGNEPTAVMRTDSQPF